MISCLLVAVRWLITIIKVVPHSVRFHLPGSVYHLYNYSYIAVASIHNLSPSLHIRVPSRKERARAMSLFLLRMATSQTGFLDILLARTKSHSLLDQSLAEAVWMNRTTSDQSGDIP